MILEVRHVLVWDNKLQSMNRYEEGEKERKAEGGRERRGGEIVNWILPAVILYVCVCSKNLSRNAKSIE